MMTSSNGNIFRVTGPLCGEFTGPGEFPTQRPVTRSFDVFFDLRLNKRLSKQPWGWWFETPSWSLWRHRNVYGKSDLDLARNLFIYHAINFMIYNLSLKMDYTWWKPLCAIDAHIHHVITSSSKYLIDLVFFQTPVKYHKDLVDCIIVQWQTTSKHSTRWKVCMIQGMCSTSLELLQFRHLISQPWIDPCSINPWRVRNY